MDVLWTRWVIRLDTQLYSSSNMQMVFLKNDKEEWLITTKRKKKGPVWPPSSNLITLSISVRPSGFHPATHILQTLIFYCIPGCLTNTGPNWIRITALDLSPLNPEAKGRPCGKARLTGSRWVKAEVCMCVFFRAHVCVCPAGRTQGQGRKRSGCATG